MNFKEDFLQLVWKYQYFDRKGLNTSDRQEVQILNVGIHNLGEGPDFKDATVVLDGVTFHGHVEVHRLASEWKQHAHNGDSAYNSVILHVVWKDDKPALRKVRHIDTNLGTRRKNLSGNLAELRAATALLIRICLVVTLCLRCPKSSDFQLWKRLW
jgi:Protein of unknown function (DUF2851).